MSNIYESDNEKEHLLDASNDVEKSQERLKYEFQATGKVFEPVFEVNHFQFQKRIKNQNKTFNYIKTEKVP